jgi:L-serine dehydratase
MASRRERIAPVADQAISVTELFTIGVGPSSSHTVGPMRAAKDFAERAAASGDVIRVRCELFGSLALTGLGHATDVAILLGLAGETPEGVDPDRIQAKAAEIRATRSMPLDGGAAIPFDEATDLLFLRGKFLAGHANAMRFTAFHADGREEQATYFSIGGGAILREGDTLKSANVAARRPACRSPRSSPRTRKPGARPRRPMPFWPRFGRRCLPASRAD